jgi:glycosyltransferase involved in cell wall biosynthesis
VPAEPGAERATGPLGGDWRIRAEAAQDSALPDGTLAVACSAPFGSGGLGRHLEEIVAAIERRGLPGVCLCPSGPPEARERRRGADLEYLPPGRGERLAARLTRRSPALRTLLESASFDARAAARSPQAEHLIAFNGQALRQFRRAPRAGHASKTLVSANSHLRRVARQHALAHRRYPLEPSWTGRLLARNLREYALADRIHVTSSYTRDSFLEEGFDEQRLTFFPLTPAPRYRPARSANPSGSYDVVYVGSLAVHKGVPLLVEAFGRLAHADMRLVLVGGWGTRGMRRFIEAACAADTRISVQPGDPLEHLRRARLAVHPAYEDGFAYAPAEALACGVPVIVSEDTGMKELIASERDGLIVPTGDLASLAEAIDAAYRGEVLA